MRMHPPSVSPLSRLNTSPARVGGKLERTFSFPPPFTGEVPSTVSCEAEGGWESGR